MNVVDVHAHVIVPELLRDAAPRDSWRPTVWREGARQVVEGALLSGNAQRLLALGVR